MTNAAPYLSCRPVIIQHNRPANPCPSDLHLQEGLNFRRSSLSALFYLVFPLLRAQDDAASPKANPRISEFPCRCHVRNLQAESLQK
jgi:hypothetical protein